MSPYGGKRALAYKRWPTSVGNRTTRCLPTALDQQPLAPGGRHDRYDRHDRQERHPPYRRAASRDVIVVGAGPTGLLLAGDLATAGIPVTLVEKRPHRTSNLSRAFVLHARTLEQLDARGLADELESKGQTLDRLRLFSRLTVDLTTLPSRFNHLLVLPQYEVERRWSGGRWRPGCGSRTRPR